MVLATDNPIEYEGTASPCPRHNATALHFDFASAISTR